MNKNIESIIPFIIISTIAFVIGFIIYGFIMVLNPKARAKRMGKMIEAQRDMLEENEDYLRDIVRTKTNITRDGFESNSGLFNSGFNNTNNKYCKHCGGPIDSDSLFCKHCGKAQ